MERVEGGSGRGDERVDAWRGKSVRQTARLEEVERRHVERPHSHVSRHVQPALAVEAEDRGCCAGGSAEHERADGLDTVRDDKTAVAAVDRKRRARRQPSVLAEIHAREGDLRGAAVRVRRVHQQRRHRARSLRDVESAVRPAVVQRLAPLLPDNGIVFRPAVKICVKPSRPHLDARHCRGEVRAVPVLVAVPPDAAVHDQVQLAFGGVLESPHLKHAAVQEAHVRHGPLILLRVVVEVPAAKVGIRARNHDLVRRGGAAATVGRIYGFSIHHDLAAVRDRHRGVSTRIVRERQRPAVQG